MPEMAKWESEKGVAFLRRIGIRSGQTVVDFGARVGHYVIPAARVVGREGRVYAFDKDAKALAELKRKSSSEGLNNIILIETGGETDLDLPDQAVDVLLLYDVLHLIEPASRQALYKEAARVLKDSGFLSVYPKHIAEDGGTHHFENVTAEDLSREVCSAGFRLQQEFRGVLSHDDMLVSGCVWNFTKKPLR